MIATNNNAIATLKAGITAGALSAVFQPIAGTPFVLPAAGTDATGVTTAGKTYGEPYQYAIIADRLDLSQAIYEIVQYSTRVDEVAGAKTYTLVQRGALGTVAAAWAAGAYVLSVPTGDDLNVPVIHAVARVMQTAVHKRSAAITWDGASLKWDTFRFGNTGRGRHFSADGYFTVAMPANGKTVVGYGGAANINVAGGVIALPESTALYFEANIGAANTDADVGDRFRAVGLTGDFVVPRHWLFIAAHVVTVAGDKGLRLCTGGFMSEKRAPGYSGAWVDFGGARAPVRYWKDADQMVHLSGSMKSGVINTAGFTLDTGFRPAATRVFVVDSNGAFGSVSIDNAGVLTPTVGNNTSVSLDGICFLAEG